jgi:hypothetical protein
MFITELKIGLISLGRNTLRKLMTYLMLFLYAALYSPLLPVWTISNIWDSDSWWYSWRRMVIIVAYMQLEWLQVPQNMALVYFLHIRNNYYKFSVLENLESCCIVTYFLMLYRIQWTMKASYLLTDNSVLTTWDISKGNEWWQELGKNFHIL